MSAKERAWERRSRNQSRRACPELVERGRLNLAQDAVLGCHSSSKSPEGTTEKLSKTWSWVRGADREFSITRHSETEMLGIVFWGNFQSSPFDKLRAGSTGLARLPDLFPGLRPGLSSAVPAGLNLYSANVVLICCLLQAAEKNTHLSHYR
jgi:hypothetical protein